jgi:hypothetical protein
MSTGNVYLFKTSGRLSLFFALHILISQNFHDLYRVGVSNLVFPDSATSWIRENAPEEFIRKCHQMCAKKAVSISSRLKELWDCHRISIIDTPYAMHTQVCSSVLVTTLISWKGSSPLIPELSYHDYQEMLQNNVMILQYLQRYIKADMYCESAIQALKRFNSVFSPSLLNRAGSSPKRVSVHDAHSGICHPGRLEYILNPLGTYPMARKEAQWRRRPEEDGAANSPNVGTAQEGSPSRIMAEFDEVLIPNFQFPNRLLDWESEISIMHGIGYPTFLDSHFSTDIPKEV